MFTIKVIKKIKSMLNSSLMLDSSLKKPKSKITNWTRYGTEYGGWNVPNGYLDENSICYCVGAGEDVSFDIELINNFNCNVITIDPTPRAIKHFNDIVNNTKHNIKTKILSGDAQGKCYNTNENVDRKWTFLPYGLWIKDTVQKFYVPQNNEHVSHSIVNLQQTNEFFKAKCKTLKTIMKELNHTNIDLLKMDIEGAEHQVIKKIFKDKIYPNILLIEFDQPCEVKKMNKTIDLIVKNGYDYCIVDGWNFAFLKKGVCQAVMTGKKMLNLGCGGKYHPDWTNVDFVSYDKNVIAHNLNEGIPFKDNEFDVVYHSHVLEHFTKDKALLFLRECYRVLKPNGILRVAIPDLEQIARLYLQKLEEGNEADYDWMMLEMYDQTVRNTSGGNMYNYFLQDSIPNLEFVLSRLGNEAELMIKNIQNNKKNTSVEKLMKKEVVIPQQIGDFRLGGEVHQWMYDRFSLARLLKEANFKNIKKTSAFESSIENFAKYELDVIDNKIRKPDSLFMEATR